MWRVQAGTGRETTTCSFSSVLSLVDSTGGNSEDFNCLPPEKSSLVKAPYTDTELSLQFATTSKHEGCSLLGREGRGKGRGKQWRCCCSSDQVTTGLAFKVSSARKTSLQSQPIISKIISMMQLSPQPLERRCPGGRGMKDHLPAQHRFWDVTNTRSHGLRRLPQRGCAHLHSSHSAVSGLAAPLPSDVLLQVKVLGEGLVTVSAFQLGGLGFA